ncbi:MAG: PAS domain S-box protein [Pyrinomonadaceae bacterium]
MNKTLRILHVEDQERDVALLSRHLRRAGYEIISERVETRETMKAALESREWNIILCDYSMPTFNALAALALVKQMKLDVPFIIISGTVGEAVAVEAMRAGAHDYLMKDNLTRLAPTIEREIQEAENRRARRIAEHSLKASEAELLALFEAITDVIFVIDVTGRFIRVAPTNPNYLSRTANSIVGKTLHELYSREKADFFLEQISRALIENRMQQTEYSLEIKGVERWFEGSVSPLSEDSVVWVARDITERKRFEYDLLESEERYRDLVENARDIIYSHDLTGKYLSVNKAAEHILGYAREECMGMTQAEVIAPECYEEARQMIERKLAGEEETVYELEAIAKDGRRVAIEVNTKLVFQDGVAVAVQGIARDVTERKHLEEQLRQAQKMEAVGQLAGGIAHDFNNLLTAINGYSELTLRRLQAEDPLRPNIEEIKKAGDRAASLTRQLLAFSRKQVLQPKVLDLNTVVIELEKMLQRLIGEDIELQTLPASDLGRINADPGQIEQVIMNLAVNARDAMPQGGKLTIETRNVHIEKEYSVHHNTVSPGCYVMLSISDNGEGMKEQVQKRIFEPFYTTKENGKGTGLGLSTVYGIVNQSGGSILVDSEIGRGTSFKIYLPQVDKSAEKYKSGAESEKVLQGTETVLLAEDDETVRNLIREVLENCGYQVLEAPTGNMALFICRHHREPIHLLLTDVIMPEMGGRELKDRLSGLRPEMKVLFMSGYTDDAIVHHGILNSDIPFIQKPFAPNALSIKVREVLDEN